MLGDYDYGDGRKEKDKYYMTFFDRQTNFPRQVARRLVAHPVPALGHGQGARRTTRASSTACTGPTSSARSRKEMGDRDAARGHEEGDALRRRHLRSGRAREVRQELRRQHRWRRRRPMTDARPSRSSSCRPRAASAICCVLWTCVSQTVRPGSAVAVAHLERVAAATSCEPFFKDGEMNQGIGRLAFYSLVRVGKGFALAARDRHADRLPPRAVARASTSRFDPIIQFLRPISPLAWLPLGPGGLPEVRAGRACSRSRSARCGRPSSTPRSACAAISQDYLNVGRVLKLSRDHDAAPRSSSRDAALRLHRLPAVARPGVARHRRRRRC